VPPTSLPSAVSVSTAPTAKWATDEQNENLYTEIFTKQVYVAPEDRDQALTEFFAQMDKLGGVRESVQAPFIFFDIMNLYAGAVESAGSTDADKVKEKLEGPLDVGLTFWHEHQWAPDDHFPSPESREVSMVPKGELVDGMFKPIE
jgi:hypothetical protein